MATTTFKGFGGVRLDAEVRGDPDDPVILLVHGACQTRRVWDRVGEGLEQSGRRVVALDLRGHGASERPADGRYDLDAHADDLRAVLAQMGSRPVVVAAGEGGWIATAALGEDAANLAAGLVLIDLPDMANTERHSIEGPVEWDERALDALPFEGLEQRLGAAVPGLRLPTLLVRGALVSMEASERDDFVAALPASEQAHVADADLLVVTDRIEAFLGILLDFLERKQPRGASEFRAGSDARTLRDALGCFATGVTVVTTLDARGTPVGLTANSFTSLSLDPPLLLVCIANSATSAPVLREAEHFAINVLQIGQQPASNRFASRSEDRFEATQCHVGEHGVPLLAGSLGSFECRRHAVHEGGDHFILVGEVVRAQFEPRRDPLLYFRGKYRRLHFA